MSKLCVLAILSYCYFKKGVRDLKKGQSLSEVGYQRLERKGISRRDFIKLISMTCLAFGIDPVLAPKMADAATENLVKKPIIWMQGLSCTGCSESLLSSLDPSPEQILLDVLSVRFHPTLMAASGSDAVDGLNECIKNGSYILVLEGAIPTADPRYCMVENQSFLDLFKNAAAKAELVLAVGSCASYGGIPRAGITGAKGARDILKGVKLVNLPSCPVKPTRLVGTLLYYLSNNALPRLDEEGRPVNYYRYTLHDSCFRRLHYESGEFLQDWNNPDTADWCLYEKGCKGQETFTTCGGDFWNDGVSFCGFAGSPCAGCSQPEYYDQLAPLFQNPKEVK